MVASATHAHIPTHPIPPTRPVRTPPPAPQPQNPSPRIIPKPKPRQHLRTFALQQQPLPCAPPRQSRLKWRRDSHQRTRRPTTHTTAQVRTCLRIRDVLGTGTHGLSPRKCVGLVLHFSPAEMRPPPPEMFPRAIGRGTTSGVGWRDLQGALRPGERTNIRCGYTRPGPVWNPRLSPRAGESWVGEKQESRKCEKQEIRK